MIKGNVSVINIQELFDTSFDEIVSAVDGKLDVVAEYVKDEAQHSAEFKDKTGYLRGSIGKRKSRYPDGGYIVFAKGNHAHLVEFGHVKVLWGHPTGGRVPAHPFMRRAKAKGIIRAIEVFRSNKK